MIILLYAGNKNATGQSLAQVSQIGEWWEVMMSRAGSGASSPSPCYLVDPVREMKEE